MPRDSSPIDGRKRFVDGGPAVDQRYPGLQPVLILLDELERRRAGDHGHDRVGVAPELRDVGREVHGPERHPELLDNLAAGLLEGALESPDDRQRYRA
jgi:hypothetical protein